MNHVYHPYTQPATTLPRPLHHHCRHHRTLSAYTHATQTTVHASQPQLPPNPHRVPRQPHRHTKDSYIHHTDPAVKVREISSYCRSARQHKRNQEQTRGAQTTYSRHTSQSPHHHIGYHDNLTDRPRTTTWPHRPGSKSERNVIVLQVNINGIFFKSRNSPLKKKNTQSAYLHHRAHK